MKWQIAPLLDGSACWWPAGSMTRESRTAGAGSAPCLRDFPPQKRYLVAVSGGRDSVTLLHWLLASGYRKLVVCHLDHRLRARSSAADARFVARLAAANDLAFETAVVEVRKLAAATKQSIEAAARAARYAFFAEVARRRRCRTIFLGHHADDLVETCLINLFRGAGLRGQRGIAAVTTHRIANLQLTVVRPLIGVWRSEIDAYVRANDLRFREDATNRAVDSLRNRMRHRIIPFLEKEFGRDIRTTVRRAALIAADEDALFGSLLPVIAERLDVKQLRSLPIALQRRALARWLNAHAVSEVGFAMIEAVRSLIEGESRAKVNLTGDRHARRRAGELFVE